MANTTMNESGGTDKTAAHSEPANGWHARQQAIYVAYHKLRLAEAGGAHPELWRQHAQKK